jgi:hypothetical protein
MLVGALVPFHDTGGDPDTVREYAQALEAAGYNFLAGPSVSTIAGLMGSPADHGELLSWLFYVGTGLGPFSGQLCISSERHPRNYPMPSTDTGVRQNAITPCSTSTLQAGLSSLGAILPSSTSRHGAGLIARTSYFPEATIHSPSSRTSSAGSSRSMTGRQSLRRGRLPAATLSRKRSTRKHGERCSRLTIRLPPPDMDGQDPGVPGLSLITRTAVADHVHGSHIDLGIASPTGRSGNCITQ